MRPLSAALCRVAVATQLFASQQAAAAIYKIVEMRGEVLALPAFASTWDQLEVGDQIAENTLVQARSSAFIAVKGVKQEDGAVPSGFSLTIPQAMITRLGPDARRSSEIMGYFPSFSKYVDTSKSRKSAAEDEKPVPDEAEGRGFVRSAWERVASLFGDDSPPSKEEQDRESSGFTGASTPPDAKDLAEVRAEVEATEDEFEPLTVLFPKSGQSFMVEQLPTPLAATWKPVGKTQTYRVVLRKEDSGTFRVVGETDETSLRFRIDSPGHYYLKVETTDGRFRSKNQLFIISTFDTLGEFSPPRKEVEMPPVKER